MHSYFGIALKDRTFKEVTHLVFAQCLLAIRREASSRSRCVFPAKLQVVTTQLGESGSAISAYEPTFVTNPDAAAAACALSGDTITRAISLA